MRWGMAIFSSHVVDFHGSEEEKLAYKVLHRLPNDYVFLLLPLVGDNGNRISLIFLFMRSRTPYTVHVLCYN